MIKGGLKIEGCKIEGLLYSLKLKVIWYVYIESVSGVTTLNLTVDDNNSEFPPYA